MLPALMHRSPIAAAVLRAAHDCPLGPVDVAQIQRLPGFDQGVTGGESDHGCGRRCRCTEWERNVAYRSQRPCSHVDIPESVALFAFRTAIPVNRLAASALAEPLSRRRSLERSAEALVRWARAA
jgi:hypothetical protein